MIRTARAPLRCISLFTILTLLAACAPTSGDLGPGATPIPTSAASVDFPSAEPTAGDPSAAPSTPTSAPSATSGASESARPSEGAAPVGMTTVRAYFFLGSFIDNAGLAPVLREIPRTQAVATAAMNALLAGPSEVELAARPAMYTAIPDGTRLLGLTIDRGIATVDLSREFESGGGTASVLGRLAQVVYTLTQFPTVQAVDLELDGQPVTVFGGEGIVLDKPVGRADYVDQLPAIFVDRPAWGAALGAPAHVAGSANVFEAMFNVAILAGNGHVLADQQAKATCGTGCRGTFDLTLPYTVANAQWGTLRVYDRSAKDGSLVDITDYPVWLTPGS